MSALNQSDRTIDGLNNQDTADLNITNRILIDGNEGSLQFLYADATGIAEWKTFRPTDINVDISKITNAQLTNKAITINGVSVDLGASGTIPTQTLTATTPLVITGDNLALDTDTTLTKISDELSVAKVPNQLTAGTNITFSSGTTYDGSSAITINSTDTNTTYTGGNGIDVDGTTIEAVPDEDTLDFNGSNELAVQKVPNNLTAGSNISFSSGSTYNGSTAITISATDTNTTYTAGTNLNLSSTTFNLDTTIDSITLTNGNLLNDNNRVLPPNVYNNGGQYVMPYSAGVFLPNDDNSYYNYCLDDDGAKTRGRGQIKTSSLELSAVIHIPRGWIATGTFMDIRDSSGNVISTYAPTYSVYYMTNFASGGTIADAVALDTNVAINTENTFYGGATFTGVYNQSLLIDINMSSTSHYLGGGYILLNAPSGGGA
jgi:hypothetical protein